LVTLKSNTERALEKARQELLARENVTQIAEEERKQRLQAEAQTREAREAQGFLETRIQNSEMAKKRAERHVHYFSIILAVITGVSACIVFLWATINWPPISNLLLRHPNIYGIQMCACGIIISISIAIFKPKWWRWCLGVSAFGFVLVLAQILGGPNPSK